MTLTSLCSGKRTGERDTLTAGRGDFKQSIWGWGSKLKFCSPNWNHLAALAGFLTLGWENRGHLGKSCQNPVRATPTPQCARRQRATLGLLRWRVTILVKNSVIYKKKVSSLKEPLSLSFLYKIKQNKLSYNLDVSPRNSMHPQILPPPACNPQLQQARQQRLHRTCLPVATTAQDVKSPLGAETLRVSPSRG